MLAGTPARNVTWGT